MCVRVRACVAGAFAHALFKAAAPKGSIAYAFTHMRDFLLLLLLLCPPPGFEAQIAASSPNHSLELESKAQGSNSNLMA